MDMTRQNNVNAELRIALDAPDGFDRFEHRQRTEDVKASHAHSVVYREFADGATCLPYALGLSENKTYQAISGDFFHRKIWAGRKFLEWLEKNNRLEEIERLEPGCLALYFADGVWKHAGRAVAGDRVVSKWGEFPVYEHEALEVPARYGEVVRYFGMPRPGDALRLFVEFSKSLGVTDDDIAEAVEFEG
ncbi:MAG: hypothetical protein WDO68_22130 [Gammaproteobacteria bacterium]